MNILFITNKNVNPVIGGIERITYVLAEAFARLHGHRCFSAFTQRLDNCATPFVEELLLEVGHETEMLRNFIRKNSVNVVIAQGADAAVNAIVGQIHDAVSAVPGCKMLFVFHNMPGFEYTRMSKDVLCYRLLHGQDVGYNLKYLVFQTFQPLLRPLLEKQMHSKYRPAYEAADRVVLLTDGFIPGYARCAGVPADGKFCAISNALTFNDRFPMEQYELEKRNEVLWVGRFDDKHKRLSEAIRIWSMVEDDGRFPDWRLRIVGYGSDENYYVSLVRRLGLRNVCFEGKTDSHPFYRSASLYMMTSAFEGFGLVITEALQSGAVPLAYDTFASLHDIIEEGYNGYIFPDGDRRGYADRMLALMADEAARKKMAVQGLAFIEKFSVENITQKWNQLFESI
ncbi:MAG: glycosyltransferase [Bacteroidales bacterium]|nr:glycosyltransferase [Bacteroidales bacterium]MCR5190088.1 glycosyltransferase [Bacteroidales bacterium]